MLRKLYGLFIYKLQNTSFFSIMQRVSGFLLLFMCYYFFLQFFFFENFLFTSFIFYLNFFLTFIVFLYFSIHFLNGLRIFATSLFYSYSLKKQGLGLDIFYALNLLFKENKILVLLKYFLNNLKNILVKSNFFFMITIFFFFIFFFFFFVLI